MKRITCTESNRYETIYKLQLGKIYCFTDQWGKKRTGKFVMVTERGFNLMNMVTSRPFFKKTFYQPGYTKMENNGKIKRTQKVFTVKIPSCISKIDLLSIKEGKKFIREMSKKEIDYVEELSIAPPKPVKIKNVKKTNNVFDHIKL